MSTEVKVSELPDCDICKYYGDTPIDKAVYDGKTTRGPWAYMCEDHFQDLGVGLGTGKGQKLIVTDNADDERKILCNMCGSWAFSSSDYCPECELEAEDMGLDI